MKRALHFLGVRWLSLPVLLIASGCAATPRPTVLDDARSALQSPEARELVALRPAMWEAATAYGTAAEQAFDKGDVNRAIKYAELVLQRVHAAENFVARDAAAEKAKIMATRLANLDKDVDRDRKDLARLQALDAKLDKLTTTTAGDRSAITNPALDHARKQLIAARAKQAEAIGVGARVLAHDKYEQGMALLEASVMALEMKLAEDSTTATTAAIAAFAAAIEGAAAAKAVTVAPGAPMAPGVPGTTAPATTTAEAASSTASTAVADQPRRDANRALNEAVSAKAAAIGASAETSSPAAFAQGRALLDSAEKRFDRGDYESALDLAKSATHAFERAGKAASIASSASSASPDENAPTEAGRSVVTTPRTPKYSIVRILIHEAENAKADAIARGALGTTAMAHGTYLLELAEKAIASGDEARATELARDARKAFGLATPPPNGPGAKLSTANPHTTAIATAPSAATATATRAASKTSAAERDAAVKAIVLAQQALADAAGRDHPETKKKKAQSLISTAEGWLDRDAFVQAKSFAESAQKELVPEPTTAPPKPAPAATAEKPIEKASIEKPVAEKPVAEKPIVQQVIIEKSAVESPSISPRPAIEVEPRRDWQGPYRKVIEALTLRDKVKVLATTPDTKAALATGMGKLAEGQAAWSRGDFSGAQALSDTAIAWFFTILSPPKPPPVVASTAPGTEAKPINGGDSDTKPVMTAPPSANSEAYRKAESLVREASALVEVCEHEKCADRNVGFFASGKAAANSARVALEAARYDHATELAIEAKKNLQASLDTPKPTIAVPVVDTEAQRKRRIEADDAIREANVQRQLCEQKKCTGNDIESWLRAESLMGAARAAFADSEFDRAKQKAMDATKVLKEAVAMQALLQPVKVAPHIEMPADVMNVVVRGNQLLVTPAFDFTSGSSNLTLASRPSIDAMAKVLLHNKDRIRSVSVVGFTDNRGAISLNVSISQLRAKTVADGLIAAGVPASLVTSSGRGPDSPIADNATAEGRSANRRVEVRFEFMDDGK